MKNKTKERKDKRMKKSYILRKEPNIFDDKFKYVLRDEANNIVFMGGIRQSIFSFADRLTESGHFVIYDDTLNMNLEQLNDFYNIESEVCVNG